MHIGIYSPDGRLLERQSGAIEELIETSCLDLSLHSFPRHQDLISALTELPMDVLFYDTRPGEGLEEQVQEVKRIIPNCALVLLGDDPRYAVFGYTVQAADFLLIPLDPEDLIALNRHFFRCHKSYVVNLLHAAALEQNSFLLDNGETVNVSRPYRQTTRSFYARYLTDRYDRDQASQVDTLPGTKEERRL